jgi:predicted ATPase with chaperone activity
MTTRADIPEVTTRKSELKARKGVRYQQKLSERLRSGSNFFGRMMKDISAVNFANTKTEISSKDLARVVAEATKTTSRRRKKVIE